MSDKITLTESQVKQQLVMYHKILNLNGTRARFILHDGQYEGRISLTQFFQTDFVFTNAEGEEVKQKLYLPLGFELDNGVFIALMSVAKLIPLTD